MFNISGPNNNMKTMERGTLFTTVSEFYLREKRLDSMEGNPRLLQLMESWNSIKWKRKIYWKKFSPDQPDQIWTSVKIVCLSIIYYWYESSINNYELSQSNLSVDLMGFQQWGEEVRILSIFVHELFNDWEKFVVFIFHCLESFSEDGLLEHQLGSFIGNLLTFFVFLLKSCDMKDINVLLDLC